jgi:mRNA-degrading endonuclease toxin of MazEF toxin-antitoxin module
MDVSYLSFDTGITDDRIYAHRGDIFICHGLFKELDQVTKDDHLLAKPTRPVMIISEDEYNKDLVKVLAFSSKAGSDFQNAINAYRSIRVPGINNSSTPSYIDVSQVFTINTNQLRTKLGHASPEIVDAAVALMTLQNVNANSMNTLLKVMRDRFPNSNAFKQNAMGTMPKAAVTNATSTDIIRSPFENIFTDVQRVTEEELLYEIKHTLKEPVNKDDAYELYQEWLNLGTDVFRNQYGLSKQQYITLRDKCVNMMLGKVSNFKKYDWST